MTLPEFEKHAGILQILQFLYGQKKEKVNITELTKKKSVKAANETIDKTMKVLVKMGLVNDERLENAFPPQRLISLTVKGRLVAQRLNEVALALQEK